MGADLAAPAGLAIGETGALPAPRHFSLVSFDEFGNLEPLPTGLGNLPLYPDHDGFFSVNGPLDLTVLCGTAVTPVNHGTNIPGFFGENTQVAPDHCQYMNDNAISRSDTSPLNLGPP